MMLVRNVAVAGRSLRRGGAGLSVRHQHSLENESALLREVVRKQDYDHYVCGLLLPQEKRASYFAIRAVNAEIAMIRDTVRTNPATGKIRMQWWRQKIAELYASPETAQKDTLLLRSLAVAIQDQALTCRWFERILDARDADLDTDQPQDVAELEIYAERTAGSLLYLTLECLGVRDDVADQVAGHAGVAMGLTTLLRATPHHCAHQQIYLPQDVMVQHSVLTTDLFEAAEDPAKGAKLAPVVFEVACRAMEHLRAARELQSQLPAPARVAFLPLVATSMYLDQLEKSNFNAFDAALQQRSPLDFHWQLIKHYFLRRY